MQSHYHTHREAVCGGYVLGGLIYCRDSSSLTLEQGFTCRRGLRRHESAIHTGSDLRKISDVMQTEGNSVLGVDYRIYPMAKAALLVIKMRYMG